MSKARVVVTFHTTTEAMAWEQACKEEGLPGRLIPMPTQISAECGLAWLLDLEDKEYLLEQAGQLGLDYQNVVELDRKR
ncbi:MAG: DUF3343 domain-containing protein [Limnochordia bacterium]|jgi:hypothetical protein|nr:DUF3343 domain-containing protein [Limnochordia bacterium]